MGLAKEGIHIKKSHKGRFTKYCEGLGLAGVTQECITKGKKAGPVRKAQAVFAENSRKFKH